MSHDPCLVQAQLVASKRQTSPIVEPAGPFTCFLHPSDPAHHENYAIPHARLETITAGAILTLIDAFERFARRPRLEYIEACAPGLEEALHAHGFRTESRTVLMCCTPQSLLSPPPVPGLKIDALTAGGSLEEYRQFKTVEVRSYWQADAPEATAEQARETRERFGGLPKVVARLDGRIVAVGSQTPAYGGIAEIAGIATLPEYRRKGIAAAVTSRLAKQAFAAGLAMVFLTAVDESAGRIYERAGFFPSGTHQINISRPA